MIKFSTPSLRTAVAVALLLSIPLSAATTASTEYRGVLSRTLNSGNNAVALPLIAKDVFRALITGNSLATVTVATGSPAATLSAGKAYYLEIESGDLEGERFDVDTAGTIAMGGSTIALSLGNASSSTVNTLSSGELSGAYCVVRPHVTLGDLASMTSPGLTGNNSPSAADSVHLHVNGTLLVFYLRGDGVSWREVGKGANEAGRIIPPDSSFILSLRSGAKTWDHHGIVRNNGFRIKMPAGSRSVSSGFPVDFSPVDFEAYVGNGAASAFRWFGNNSAATADKLQVFDAALGSFVTYYLRGDGSSWRKLGEQVNVQSLPLIKSSGMTVVTRTNPDPAYYLRRPF